MNKPTQKDIERFWTKVDKRSNHECWEWQSCKNKADYGRFSFRNKSILAHRFMWLIIYGKMPKKHVLHKCDNPCCVNPVHLFLGTNTDNMRDMMNKGRCNLSFRGEQISKAKTGMTYSEKHKKAISDSLKCRSLSSKHITNIRNSRNKIILQKESSDKILELYKIGESIRKISRITGVSRQSIKNILVLSNVEIIKRKNQYE